MNTLIQAINAFLFKTLISLTCLISALTHAATGDPQIPSIERSIHLSDHGEYERPYIPVYRTTHDGRLGMNFEQGFRLYLNAPEKFGSNFHESPNGQSLLANDTQPFFSDAKRIYLQDGAADYQHSHVSFCEPTDAQGKHTNPYACGANNEQDCYKVVFMTMGYTNPQQTQGRLYGNESIVHVSNPKTPDAKISHIDWGTVTPGSTIFNLKDFFEPTVTQDGNLMLARVNGSQFNWYNKRTKQMVNGNSYNMVYLAAPQDPSRSCDVTQWKKVKPLGHAPYDPEINGTGGESSYGFALQPFVDSLGNVVPDETDLAGTYPWVDSKGDNIVFNAFSTPLGSDFPVSCVENRGCDDNNFSSSGDFPLLGKTIVGLWTQGKMILMDNMVNHSDYLELSTEDRGHRNIDMYQAGTRADDTGTGLVRVSAGRDKRFSSEIEYRIPGDELPGQSHNTTFVESIENKLNYWKHLKPVTPRDVVWHFSSGAASDEIAFDDYLNPDAFIVSSMVQAVVNNGNDTFQYNGKSGLPVGVQNGAAVHLNEHNLPSNDHWRVPRYGRVTNGRIETVAQGGVHGKGLWIKTNNTYVTYAIPSQPKAIHDADWYIGIFVDARFDNDTTARTLITFPDGSELQLVGRDQVRYWSTHFQHTIDLPQAIPDTGWAHLGIQMSNQNKTAALFFNGFTLDRYTRNSAFFTMESGNLYLGDNPNRNVPGFHGWIDEFKVIAQNVGTEVACNHANGSLMGFNSSSTLWNTIAQGYDQQFHNEISTELQNNGKPSYIKYACYHDYNGDYLAYVDNIPSGHFSVRDHLIFPEGPLIYNQPRPDSSNNAFCLSCHTSDGKQGLGLGALTYDANTMAMHDIRRQPTQPYPWVYGNIPANWLGEGVPSSHIVATNGISIDELLLTGNPPQPSAAPWPELPSSNAIRNGQSLLHQSSGMEIQAMNGDATLGFKPNNYSTYDWVIKNAGGGYVYIENPNNFTRLSLTADLSDVISVANTNTDTHSQWQLQASQEGWSFIVNRASGQKLSANYAEEYQVNMVADDSVLNNVHWKLIDYVKPKAGDTPPLNGYIGDGRTHFYIENIVTGYRAHNCSSSDGSVITMSDPSDITTPACDTWITIDSGDEHFWIRSSHNNKNTQLASNQDGTEVKAQPESWTGNFARWKLINIVDNHGHIQHKGTGNTISSQTTDVGAPLIGRSASAGSSRWRLINAELPVMTYYTIQHKSSGTQLHTCNYNNGTEVHAVTNPSNNCAKWARIDNNDDFFYLQNKSTGKFVQPHSGANNVPLVSTPLMDTMSQWSYVNTNDGYGHIVNRQTGKFLFREGNSNSVVKQQPSTWTGDLTRWKFIENN